eukprot:5813488-Prymnesium_polylepis.1
MDASDAPTPDANSPTPAPSPKKAAAKEEFDIMSILVRYFPREWLNFVHRIAENVPSPRKESIAGGRSLFTIPSVSNVEQLNAAGGSDEAVGGRNARAESGISPGWMGRGLDRVD